MYKGLHIPAGTTIIDNAWCAIQFCRIILVGDRMPGRAMFRDASVYPDPHVFNPDRFLKDGQINPNVKDPEEAGGFGWGRRYFVHTER